MANPTSAAGDNGVSGSEATEAALLASIDGQSGTLAGADFSMSGDTAVRHSVARTRRGYDTATPASEVYSVTQNLRFAYHEVECDSPAVTRT